MNWGSVDGFVARPGGKQLQAIVKKVMAKEEDLFYSLLLAVERYANNLNCGLDRSLLTLVTSSFTKNIILVPSRASLTFQCWLPSACLGNILWGAASLSSAAHPLDYSPWLRTFYRCRLLSLTFLYSPPSADLRML
jgi:hypothetical protein